MFTMRATFGSPETGQTSCAFLCPTLEDVLRNAEIALRKGAPVPWSVEILTGDHAPRLIDGEWAWPTALGWRN